MARPISDYRLGVMDVETTGLQETLDKIIQFSGVSCKILDPKSPVKYLDIIINPEIHMSYKVAAIHKLSDEILSKYTGITKEKLKEIVDFMLSIDYVVCFNGINFDKPRVKRWLKVWGKLLGVDIPLIPALEREWIDIFKIIRQDVFRPYFHDMNNFKQITLAKKLGVTGYNAHNSLEDCKCLADCFYILLIDEIIPADIEELILIQSKSYKQTKKEEDENE